MPFNWKNSPGLPQPPQPIIIPPTAITYKVDQVANTVNWGGTLLYNTAPAVYDVIYPSNGSNISINTANFATMEYVNNAIANVTTGAAGNSFVTIWPQNRYVTGEANVIADSNNDVLTIHGGKAIIITTNASNDMVEIHGLASTAIHPSYNTLVYIANTWFTETVPVTSSFNGGVDVLWIDSLQQFVASRFQIGTSSIMTSYDGINWSVKTTPSPSNPSDKHGGRMAYSPELGLIVCLIEETKITRPLQVYVSSDANNWSLVTVAGNSSTQIWRDIVWSSQAGLFVAVSGALDGSGSTAGPNTKHVMTSPDGYIWTLRDTGISNVQFYGIAYSPSLSKFVVSGRLAYFVPGPYNMMYSSDGITWTGTAGASITFFDASNPFYSFTSGNNTSWFDVTWASGPALFVAVGGSIAGWGTPPNFSENLAYWATSTDGITWTNVQRYDGVALDRHVTPYGIYTSPTGTIICYAGTVESASGPSGFVIDNLTGNTNSASFFTSTDGVIWTNVTEPTPTWGWNHWKGMAYSPTLGRYVGVASRLEWYTNNNVRTDIIYSATAADHTWTTVPLRHDAYTPRCCTWSPERGEYIVVHNMSASNVFPAPVIETSISRDGKTWTKKLSTTYIDASLSWESVTWSPELEKYVAVGSTTISGGGSWNNVSNTLAATSSDGQDWTIHSTPIGLFYGWQRVTWSPALGLFVAVNFYGGLAGNQIMTSPDGVTWTIRNTPVQANDFFWWYGITWSPELALFVAVAQEDSETQGLMTSPDGVNWTARATTGLAWWYGVAWSPELRMFAATCSNTNFYPQVATSHDGITWTNATSDLPYTDYWGAIVWSHEYQAFVASGSTYVIMSRDGINWITVPTTNMAVSDDLTWSPELGQFFGISSGTFSRSNVAGIWRTITESIYTANLQTEFIGILPESKGGTGKAGSTANGQLLIGNTVSGGFDLRQLIAGSGVTITNGKGTITIASTGGGGSSGNSFVTINVAGQANVVADSNADTVIFAIGPGIAITTNAITDTVTWQAAINNTYPILVDQSTINISHATSGVTATTYGNANHVFQGTVDTRGHVTSASNVKIAIDTAQITSGTLSVARGGTANGTAPANGAIPIGNTVSGGYDINTLTQGTGITITNDKGSITIAATGGAAVDQYARDTANGAFAQANGAFNKANAAVPNTGVTVNGSVLIGNTVSGGYDLRVIAQTAPVIVTNGQGTITLSHASSGVTATTYGNASHISSVTVDQYGHVTTASNAKVAIAAAQITSGATANGQLLIGNTVSGAFDVALIAQSAPIIVTNLQGGITLSHARSGVTATGYGDLNHIPVFVVDANGHITSVTNTAIGSLDTSAITTGVLSVARGGTANGTTPANGAIPIGNSVSGGYDINTLTQGTGIVITNDKGSITIAATGGSSIDQFARDHANGAFDTANGAFAKANAATPNTATANGQIYAGNSVSGQFDLTTIAQTAPVIVTNGRGTITLSHASSGVVATTYGNANHVFQGTVDQYGHITTASNVKISIDTAQIGSGVLGVARGGTANGTAPANGAIPIGNTVSGGYDINTLTQGTGIVITNDKGSITIAATGGSSTDQFARDQANAAFNKANAATPNTATANGQIYAGNSVSGQFDLTTIAQTAPVIVTNGRGTITLSHASSGVAATGYGTLNLVPVFVVDQYGHVTSVTNTAIGSLDTSVLATGILSVARGGTGKDATGLVNGALLIGNTVNSGFDLVTIAQTAPVIVTNGLGTITLSHASSGVTATTYGNASHVSQVTVDQYGHVTVAANVKIGIAAAQITSGAGANGQLLIGNTVSGAFDTATLTQGTGGITIVNDKGSITISDSTRFTKGLSVFTPNVTDNITCFFTSNTLTMRQCVSVVQGTNPNVTYRLSYSNTRATGTVGTAITGDIVCANTTNGVFTTTFSNGTVPANNYLFLQFPSVANTVTEFALTMEYTM